MKLKNFVRTILSLFICTSVLLLSSVVAYANQDYSVQPTNDSAFIITLIVFISSVLILLYKNKSYITRDRESVIVEFEEVEKIASAAGYLYDPKQDIFYTKIDAWQREMGYCRLYDEGAAPLSMIIDCEPIYFKYGGKRWLIEMWKGQYGMTTGSEIGIYNTTQPDLDIPNFYKGAFYNTASDEEMLKMSMTLKKGNKKLFKQSDRHWWLTGFVVGKFSEPSELVMNVSIILKDSKMRDAFIKGMLEAGYNKNEIKVSKNTVSFVFDKPRTEQPKTRTELIETMTQKKNKLLCDEYMAITEEYETFQEKIIAVQKNAPYLFNRIMTIGKPKELYKAFEKIKGYLK